MLGATGVEIEMTFLQPIKEPHTVSVNVPLTALEVESAELNKAEFGRGFDDAVTFACPTRMELAQDARASIKNVVRRP